MSKAYKVLSEGERNKSKDTLDSLEPYIYSCVSIFNAERARLKGESEEGVYDNYDAELIVSILAFLSYRVPQTTSFFEICGVEMKPEPKIKIKDKKSKKIKNKNNI